MHLVNVDSLIYIVILGSISWWAIGKYHGAEHLHGGKYIWPEECDCICKDGINTSLIPRPTLREDQAGINMCMMII